MLVALDGCAVVRLRTFWSCSCVDDASCHGSDVAISTVPEFSTSSPKGPLVGEAGEIVVWQVVEGSCELQYDLGTAGLLVDIGKRMARLLVSRTAVRLQILKYSGSPFPRNCR